MNKISRFIIWICKKFTKDEIIKIIAELLDVVENRNLDLKPRDDFREKHPNYRDFKVDPLPALTEPPDPKSNISDYKILLKKYKNQNGKPLKPVQQRNGSRPVPNNIICPYCKAPHNYIYFNNGKKKSQLKCKVCNSVFPVNKRYNIKTKYYCPYCGCALYRWKTRLEVTMYKCGNDNCPHRIRELNKLNPAEKKLLKKRSSQFKLNYQYREYHYRPGELELSSPHKPKVDLTKIHNSSNVLGLVLALYISYAITARKTAHMLRNIFGICLSHQTVLNYMEAAAYYCHQFNLQNKGDIDEINPGDETYIKIKGENNYVWLFMSPETRKIIAYHVSDNRGTLPAITTMKEAIRTAKPDQAITLITDGNPSYQAGVHFINAQQDKEKKLILKNVIGLQNLDDISEEFRPYKQMIERLNRTYKYHVKPANGFGNFNGAVAVTALFVTHYNFLRPHMALNYKTPISLSVLQGISTIQGKWTKIISLAT